MVVPSGWQEISTNPHNESQAFQGLGAYFGDKETAP